MSGTPPADDHAWVRLLEQLDPTRVRLPRGTEVTTRVDRVLGARVVPEGAIGRVVGGDDQDLEVEVAGVGRVPYRREEVVPRKTGQVRYALRREHAWESLSGCVVLETLVGSHAWGLAHEGSDRDLRGAFALPFAWTIGLEQPPFDLVSAEGDATYWEVGKAIEQALRADPNTLEMLFVPGARALDEIGAWILEARDAFVSRGIYGSFGRYALSQLKRLQQSARLAGARDALMSFLKSAEQPTLDVAASHLARVAGIDAPTEADRHLRAKEYVKEVYRSLFDRGLLPSREFASFVEFARAGGAALETSRELRPKNAYNLLRLLVTATRWLREGTPTFAFDGPLRDELLAIKRGEVPIEAVLARGESLAEDLEAARHESSLPLEPDVERADRLLRRVRIEMARRHFERSDGAPERAPSRRALTARHEDRNAMNAIDGLSDHARRVSLRVLDEEETLREHVVVAISGAHAYGFPSPDSDVDVKAVHVAPAHGLLGIHAPPSTANRLDIIEGVEIDYTSNELAPVVAGLLGGNGNYLERVAGACILRTNDVADGLRELGLATLSRRYHRHYAGFSRQLLSALEEKPSVKKALYVLRTALTGAHLLLTGELRVDLRTVIDEHGFGDARALIEEKRAGERTALSAERLAGIRPMLARALALLDDAKERSVLPEEPRDAAGADAWLVRVRLEALADRTTGGR